ncbi:hypothetical protein CYMTET_8552, partial [Cymbomonas tetramitiformis]
MSMVLQNEDAVLASECGGHGSGPKTFLWRSDVSAQENAPPSECNNNTQGYAYSKLRTMYAAFLPEGFPATVSDDYLSFQLWDTVQGLCSYVRGVLTTQALLAGLGVGQEAATPLGAALQWVLRDLVGMVGGVTFSLYQGNNLDSCAKQWRFFADCMNNVGLFLELMAPYFPLYFM